MWSGKHDPKEDARALRAAGGNEDAIIKIITKRTNDYIQKICEQYKLMYRKDLISELICTLGEDVKEVIIALMIPRYDYYAIQLKKILTEEEVNLTAIVEIVCPLFDYERAGVEDAYRRIYANVLACQSGDDKEDTLGIDMKRANVPWWARELFKSIFNVKRYAYLRDGSKPARYRAQQLNCSIEYGDGIRTLIYILFQHHKPERDRILGAYREEYGNLEDDIRENFFDIQQEVLLAILRCVKAPSLFLENCLLDKPEDHTTLIRIVVTRSERNYRTFSDFIKYRTSGSLQKWLLAIVQ
ncbi:hypothetical protein PPYR_11465 [Photinus pyralis]|uniref:Annexin n=1 Tax=Photinus pyralis TaxID=7054 RepID=A0A1Y1L3H6_PHOPY|nr:annexin B9-like [Photinus pyralis]XP_031350987.1 annexin B9-like [Photinus pyralis]KAB0794626.1 hypothetical protein PPYR_11465 [Photinus pyralis]